jgi:hypothetical protein
VRGPHFLKDHASNHDPGTRQQWRPMKPDERLPISGSWPTSLARLKRPASNPVRPVRFIDGCRSARVSNLSQPGGAVNLIKLTHEHSRSRGTAKVYLLEASKRSRKSWCGDRPPDGGKVDCAPRRSHSLRQFWPERTRVNHPKVGGIWPPKSAAFYGQWEINCPESSMGCVSSRRPADQRTP